MNKLNQLTSPIFAAGAAGVAVFSFANAPFTAGLPGDVILGIGASVALLGFAIFDYSRQVRSLTVPARLLRPTVPARHAEVCAGKNPCNGRIAA